MSERFGLMLRRYRHAAGLSQYALADLAGTDQSWVLRLEAGTRRPSRSMALRLGNALAPALEVDPSALGDTLAVAAGHLPRDVLAYALRDEPELVALAELLGDETVPAGVRADARGAVRLALSALAVGRAAITDVAAD